MNENSGKKRSVKSSAKPKRKANTPKGPPKPKVRVYTIKVPIGTPPPALPQGEEAYPWVLVPQVARRRSTRIANRAANLPTDLYTRTVPVVEGMEPGMQALLDAFEGRVQIVDNDAVDAAIAAVDQEVEGLAGAFGAAGVGAPPAWQWQPGAAAAAPAPAAPIGFNAQGLNDRWRAAVAARGPAEPPAPRGEVWEGPINMPRFGPAPARPPPQGWGGENANLGGGRRTRKKKSKKSKKSRRH